MGCCPNIRSRAAIAALLLYGQFTLIADILSRLRLPSSSSDDLLVPAVRLPTVGRRTFLVAGARTWNKQIDPRLVTNCEFEKKPD